MTDINYKYLVGSTPAILGLHDVNKFSGQASPEMFRMTVRSRFIDRPLLSVLLDRWVMYYSSLRQDWKDIALYRSLNVAYQASLLPAGRDATFYDLGTKLCLWVSAFEILVHPGENGRADRSKVFELLDSAPWEREACLEKRLHCKEERTAACHLYNMLYKRRNDFIHGNPIDPSEVIIPESGQNLMNFAAPLYRAALIAFLPLRFDRVAPSEDNAEAMGEYADDYVQFARAQGACEEALLLAFEPPKEVESR